MSDPTKQIAGILKMLEHNAEMQKRATTIWKNRAMKHKAERDEIQAAFTSVRDHRDQLDDQLYRLTADSATLPRVITADELREGQWIASIAVNEPRPLVAGQVTKAYARDEGGRHVELNHGDREWFSDGSPGSIVLLAEEPGPKRRGEPISYDEIEVGDVLDIWDSEHVDLTIGEDLIGVTAAQPREDDSQFYPLHRADGEPTGWGIPPTPNYEEIRLVSRPKRPSWRGSPITPQSIRKNDLYDIHTAQGTTITGILAGRNGIHRPQPGDQYRLVSRGN